MGDLIIAALFMLLLLFLGNSRLLNFFLSLVYITALMLMAFCPGSPFQSRPPWVKGIEAGVILWFAMASVAKVFRK
jgi:hypothetical protein